MGFKGIQLDNPVQQYANMLSIENAQNQNRLADFQYKTGVEAQGRQNALRSALGAAGGDEAAYGNALTQFGTPEQVAAYRKAKLEGEKTAAEMQKLRLETGVKALEQYRQMMPTDPESAAQWIQAQYADPLVSPIVSRMQPVQAALSRIPTDPAAFQQWVAKNALGMEKFITENKPQLSTRDTGGKIEDRTFRPLTGEITTLGTTAKTATPDGLLADARGRVSNSIAAGNLAVSQGNLGLARQRLALEAGDGKPLTETQGASTAFGMRAMEASNILADLESKGTLGIAANVMQGPADTVAGLPLVGGAIAPALSAAGNILTSAPQQKYAQAKQNFISAVLRKESGAVIADSEAAREDRKYFPQVGDSDEVIAQKREARKTAVDALRVQAGPGSKKIPASGTLTTAAPPKGVDAKLWAVMTPEEKALWK